MMQFFFQIVIGNQSLTLNDEALMREARFWSFMFVLLGVTSGLAIMCQVRVLLYNIVFDQRKRSCFEIQFENVLTTHIILFSHRRGCWRSLQKNLWCDCEPQRSPIYSDKRSVGSTTKTRARGVSQRDWLETPRSWKRSVIFFFLFSSFFKNLKTKTIDYYFLMAGRWIANRPSDVSRCYPYYGRLHSVHLRLETRYSFNTRCPFDNWCRLPTTNEPQKASTERCKVYGRSGQSKNKKKTKPYTYNI